MKFTLTELLKECIRDSKSARAGGMDPNRYPSQILCLAEMVQFTERCEEAIRSHNLQVGAISVLFSIVTLSKYPHNIYFCQGIA